MMAWGALLAGWPAIGLSIVLSALGVYTRRSRLLFLGALVILPFAFYLNGQPAFKGWGLYLPLFQVAAGLATRRGQRWLAGALLLPLVGVSAWLLIVVI